MMRQLIILLFACGLYSCSKDKATTPVDVAVHNELIAGGGTISFQRLIGGQKLDNLYSVKQTMDGGYIFCGFTENDDASERDVLLIRTNSKGETIWLKKFSDVYTDQGWFVDTTSDGGFIIAATSTLSSALPWASLNPYKYNGQLIKTDANGNQTWKKSFTFGNHTSFTVVRQTSDGGYIISGSEYDSGKGFLLKTDGSGNESWRKTYGWLVETRDMDKTNDGGFIICGSIKTTSSPQDIYIIRTNPTGDTTWTKTYGDSMDNVASAIKETPSGNFILCGHNANPGLWGYVKLIDSNGSQIWHTDFLTYNIQGIEDISTTNDNQFIAIGIRNTSGNITEAFLQKIDNNGNSIWIKSFNPRNYNPYLYEVHQTMDNGFIVTGHTSGDGYIIKTDANGN